MTDAFLVPFGTAPVPGTVRRMMRELDLEEEALASSWVTRLRD
jgi:hypothetical protein